MCIIGAILAVAFACCVVCGFKSLKMAIDVIDASADYLASAKRVILVPVLYFFLTIICLLIWVPAFACVASMNDITADTDVIPQAKNLEWNSGKVKLMALFMLFGIFWICAWLKYSA